MFLPFMLANGFFWLVLLVGAVFLISALLRGWSGPTQAAPGVPMVTAAAAEDPLAIVSARYARGEIGREEFLRVRDDLTAARGGDRA